MPKQELWQSPGRILSLSRMAVDQLVKLELLDWLPAVTVE